MLLAGNMLSNFIVGTMNVSTPVIGQYSLCASYPNTAVNGAVLTVVCFNSTAPGSHLFVKLLNPNYLNIILCEVKVYGTGMI